MTNHLACVGVEQKRSAGRTLAARHQNYIALVGLVIGLVTPTAPVFAASRPAAGKEIKACAECPTMVVIPAGSFTMGGANDPKHDDDELPNHKVSFAKPFAMGKFEVTFREWDACVAAGGCQHKPDDEGWGRGERPVINVSWDDIQEYLAWLNKRTGQNYRLPSEAEWEYAARAGTKTVYSWGDAIGRNNANCNGCGSQWDNKQTAPVGSFSANAWGLHDMHGNVWERVEDCWHSNYNDAPADGVAWLQANGGSCNTRVLRGGSWFYGPAKLRAAYRYFARGYRFFLGFRLAQDL